MTVKQFSDAFHEWKCVNTTMPYPKRDRFTDSTEKGLVLMIKAHCKMNGYESLVYDAKGSWSQSLGRYVYSKMDLGRPDVYVFIPAGNGLAKIIAVEIKIGRDKQREKQEKYMKETRSRGNAYIIVRSWDDYYRMVMSVALELSL